MKLKPELTKWSRENVNAKKKTRKAIQKWVQLLYKKKCRERRRLERDEDARRQELHIEAWMQMEDRYTLNPPTKWIKYVNRGRRNALVRAVFPNGEETKPMPVNDKELLLFHVEKSNHDEREKYIDMREKLLLYD